MWVTGQPGQDERSNQGEPGDQEKLDRALVAGLILEVVLEQTDLPEGSQARQHLVKTRIQEYLVRHLAGRVSLDRFRALARNLDGWFDFYYPLLVADGPASAVDPPPLAYSAREAPAVYRLHEPHDQERQTQVSDSPASRHRACLDALLDNWLEAARTDIPQRSHRKLTPGKLRSFLRQSGGRWFRLRDFERYVQMDRKTAWDYLQQFLHTGLLCHNQKNSAAVRYCLAPCFLRVEADALRLALSLCLKLHPENLVEKVSDFLIATGGEAFAVVEWEQDFPVSLLEELVACNIIRWQELPTGARFLKLHRRWLQPHNQPPFPENQTITQYRYPDYDQ